jgi:predicted DNA repair protein MutK
MSAGLAALLDDISVLARAAAASIDDVAAGAGKASVKAVGVIVDDTAVTPRYVQGLKPERELPMIRRIAVGSVRNKIVFILPVVLVLSQWVDWLLTPILMVGGAYLCFEGAEKLWEAVGPDRHHHKEAAAAEGPADEDTLVGGAIRTDFILSAEIMVISLNEVTDEPFVARALILVAVAFLITAIVYGTVALIVKMDDVGLRLARTGDGGVATFGRGLVRGMPIVLNVLSTVGIAAMLWVGGHILLVGLKDLGAPWLYDHVHHIEEDVHDALGAFGAVGGWLTNTAASAVLGIVVGGIVLAVVHRLRHRGGHGAAKAGAPGGVATTGSGTGAGAGDAGTGEGEAGPAAGDEGSTETDARATATGPRLGADPEGPAPHGAGEGAPPRADAGSGSTRLGEH